MRQYLSAFFACIVALGSAWAQSSVPLIPELPVPGLALISVEGEDAISTNFAREPVIRYGASGKRLLRLERKSAPYGGLAWYAEYAFIVEESGQYDLWYLGTPPASSKPEAPGYFCSVYVSLDGKAYQKLNREGGQALGSSDPALIWFDFGKASLTAGTHTLRFEIRDKRTADGAYVFELDTIQAIRSMDEPKLLPAGSREDPYAARAPLADSEYERILRTDPANAGAYRALLEIAFALGDMSSAVRYSQRAAAAIPSDPYYVKALARARIGIEDVPGGMSSYERYLGLQPDDLAGWQEAAKTAAWRSQYAQAIALYHSALSAFPGDPNLSVDYGLALVWSGQGSQGNVVLANAERLALADPINALGLANAFSASGYPDRAISLLEAAVKAHPAVASLRFSLARALERRGNSEKADDVMAKARTAYAPDDRFSSWADREEERIRLAREALRALGERSSREPDNLALREQYVQALFWNGQRSKAIDAYAALIVGKAYEALCASDVAALDETLDLAMAARMWAASIKPKLDARSKELRMAMQAEQDARKKLEAYTAKVAKEEAAGRTVAPPEGIHPQQELEQAAATLSIALEREYSLAQADKAFIARALGLAAELERRAEADKALHAAFLADAASMGWFLDRQLWASDAKKAALQGDSLGWFTLTRLPGYSMNKADADMARRNMASSGVPALLYASFTDSLARQDAAAAISLASGPAALWRPHVQAVAAMLGPQPEATPVSAESYTSAEEALTALAGIELEAKACAQSLGTSIATAELTRSHRDERVFRLVERDTVAMRRELGSFFVAVERPQEAAAHFRNAVRNEPSDSASMFELAAMRQSSGDWQEAMKLYRQVYGWDPSFANVQGFHNSLARTYADVLDASVFSSVDPSIASTETRTSYSLGATSWLNLAGGLSIRDIRRYTDRDYQVDDGLGGSITISEAPSVQAISDAFVRARIQNPGSWFSAELEAGAVIADERGSAQFIPQNQGIPGALNGLRKLPRAALRFRFGANGPSAVLNLAAGPMDESFIPGRPLLYRGSGELSITLPFGDFSYSRSYARADAIAVDLDLADTRLIATGFQELAFGIHLDDAPWTNLMLSLEGSVEHALRQESWLYYAPNLVLNLKGAAHYLTWIGLSRGNVLGLSARLAAGMFSDNGDACPIVQAEARAEWTRRDALLYLRAFGSQSFPSSGKPYWNIGFELGGSVKVPDLIAP